MKTIKRQLKERLDNLIEAKERSLKDLERREKAYRQVIIEEEILFPNKKTKRR